MASARRYLRANVPAIYSNDPDGFAMHFLWALECVLDPQIAILDSLPSYFSPQLAPPGMVGAIAGWLGLPPATEEPARKLVRTAERLARSRGTRAGVQLLLECCFEDLSFTVEDHGTVLAPGRQGEAFPGFTVRCEQPLSSAERCAVERAIEWQRPLQTRCTLIDAAGVGSVCG